MHWTKQSADTIFPLSPLSFVKCHAHCIQITCSRRARAITTTRPDCSDIEGIRSVNLFSHTHSLAPRLFPPFLIVFAVRRRPGRSRTPQTQQPLMRSESSHTKRTVMATQQSDPPPPSRQQLVSSAAHDEGGEGAFKTAERESLQAGGGGGWGSTRSRVCVSSTLQSGNAHRQAPDFYGSAKGKAHYSGSP